MEPTTLEDLKIAWKELSQKLERQNRALHQLRESKLAQFRIDLRQLVIGKAARLVGGVLLIWVGWLWARHVSTPIPLVCAILLLACGIMRVAFAIRDLSLIRRVNFAAPVIEIQKQLADLRAWQIRAAFWFGVMGSVLWLPFFLLAFDGQGSGDWLGKPQNLIWLIANGLICLGIAYGLFRLSCSSGKWGAALRRSWIGRSVNRAQATLDEIERFERELN